MGVELQSKVSNRRRTEQSLLRALLCDHRGAAAVEFGLLTPMLITLLFGMVDFGQLTYQWMQVQAAAHAGADYALHSGYNSSAITTAVTGATPLTVNATPAPALITACIVSGVLSVTAATTCSSGGAPGSYVVVKSQATFTPIISWAAFGLPTSLTAQATVRIS